MAVVGVHMGMRDVFKAQTFVGAIVVVGAFSSGDLMSCGMLVDVLPLGQDDRGADSRCLACAFSVAQGF